MKSLGKTLRFLGNLARRAGVFWLYVCVIMGWHTVEAWAIMATPGLILIGYMRNFLIQREIAAWLGWFLLTVGVVWVFFMLRLGMSHNEPWCLATWYGWHLIFWGYLASRFGNHLMTNN